jgi:hypothetical protein
MFNLWVLHIHDLFSSGCFLVVTKVFDDLENSPLVALAMASFAVAYR